MEKLGIQREREKEESRESEIWEDKDVAKSAMIKSLEQSPSIRAVHIPSNQTQLNSQSPLTPSLYAAPFCSVIIYQTTKKHLKI